MLESDPLTLPESGGEPEPAFIEAGYRLALAMLPRRWRWYWRVRNALARLIGYGVSR